MEMTGDLFGDQGGVAACAVVDDEIDPGPVLYGLVHDLGRVLDHFQIFVGNDSVRRWITSPARRLEDSWFDRLL